VGEKGETSKGEASTKIEMWEKDTLG